MLHFRMLQRVKAEEWIRRLAILEAILMVAILSALLITSIVSNNRLSELQRQSQQQAQQQRDNIQKLLEEQERINNLQTEYLKCLIQKAVEARAANIEFTPEGCDVVLQQMSSPSYQDSTESSDQAPPQKQTQGQTESPHNTPSQPGPSQPEEPEQPPAEDHLIGCLPLIEICI